MKIKNKIPKFIGLVIFIIILSQIDYQKLISVFSNVKITFLVLAIIFSLPFLIIKSWRWNYLKKKQAINYPLKESLYMYGSGLFWGFLTPGRIGDFVKVIYLKKDGHPLMASFVTVLVDRILDLFSLTLLAYIGMLVFANLLKNQLICISVLLLSGIAGLITIAKTNILNLIFRKTFNIFFLKKYQKTWQIGFKNFKESLKTYEKIIYFKAFLLTLLSWFFYFLLSWFLAQSFGITKIPIIYLTFSICLASFVNLLPISFSGIGTRDLVLILLFAQFGISKELAISYSFGVLLIIITMTIIGFLCHLARPLSFSKKM